MCGISGIINFNKKVDLEVVKRMNAEIKYRGPDHSSIFSNSFCAAGNVRLKIIDLSDLSNQPFVSFDKKITLIYNGEIYNFKDLKKKYFEKIVFKSTGDGEVLLFLYQKFGIEFINKIKGMFSIFISDENKKTTYLIRDRFGIKPLYYNFNKEDKELTFCSEIPGIFQNKKVNKKANYFEAYRYLNSGLVNATHETWFKNIYQVKPSTYLQYNGESIKEVEYYSFKDAISEDNDENTEKTFYSYAKSIYEKLSNSYDQHTVFDVKGGIHQSGGADSSILVALTKIKNKKFDTFTFDYQNKKFSELETARKLSTSVKLKNFSSVLQDNDIESYLQKVIHIQYEPFSSLRVLSNTDLYEKYSNKCKVILDGGGGDEVAAGYHYHVVAWHLDMLKSNKINNLEQKLSRLIKNHESLKPKTFYKGALARLMKTRGATEDGSEYSSTEYLQKDFLKDFASNYKIKAPFKSHLRNAQFADLFHLKLPRSLRYVDRASMRFGVETRLPFLDHELVEECFQLPNKFKMVNGQQRAVFKHLFRNTIDRNILFANKRTIADPQTYWLKNHLSDFVNDTLRSIDAKNNNIIDTKKIIKFYDKFKKTKEHVNSFFMFQVLNTILWEKNILKK